MGILDALRGRRSGRGDGNGADGSRRSDRAGGSATGIGPGDPAAPDPTDFHPRTDGSYVSQGSRLRFTGNRVSENTGDGAEPGSPVRVGEYTSSGRFTVSAQFERLVVFTVTEIGDDYFVARRTSSGDRTSVELRYVFRRDAG